MAGEIISTALTTSYELQSGDNLYITRTGSVTMNSGFDNAIYADTAVTSVSILVDGLVVAISGSLLNPSAIRLSAGAAATDASFDITIGAGGMLRSFNGHGVSLFGSDSDIRNDGSVIVFDGALTITGDDSEITNTGFLSATTGMSIVGADAELRNAGEIDASTGIRLSGSGSIVNSGSVLADNAGLSVFASSASGIDATVSNSGTVETAVFALVVGGAAGTEVSVLNTGLLAGGSGGIDATAEVDVFVTNAAGAVISGTTGSAIDSDGMVQVTNFGSILSAGDVAAIRLGASAGFSSITNHGSIGSAGGIAVNASALLTGGSLFLFNHGTIAGNYFGAGFRDAVKNFGSMDGISTGGENDTVRNAGLIDGFVLLSAGDDRYSGGGGRVDGFVDGGTGNDSLTGGAEDDDLRGGTDDDLLAGGRGDDVLGGSLGRDSLDGGAGDDLLLGDVNEDRLTGGADADIFRFATRSEAGNGNNADLIVDFGNGADRIDVSAFMAGADYLGDQAFTGTGREVRYVTLTGRVEGDQNGDGVVDWALVLESRPTVTAGDFIF